VTKCEECGSTNEVLPSSVWWTAWGRNAFDFNWEKNEGTIYLCEKCENENWVYCNSCGAPTDADHYGRAYLPEDYDDDMMCPGCWWEKREILFREFKAEK